MVPMLHTAVLSLTLGDDELKVFPLLYAAKLSGTMGSPTRGEGGCCFLWSQGAALLASPNPGPEEAGKIPT